ncbi:hypothetical protein [Actinomadura rugatobispora]|uniref:Uncharacterized protein n=1 Tax=Actinomadura rugatobispora TaxID=1994 RepID=A0ABW1AC20_9ACTN|nr:hypothetical protein GCM10010200_079590 [Actinomadura rugatobispora]
MTRAPADGRFEFLSGAWIEEAARFVRNAAPDVRFTLCETFTDPPPGIGGAWHVRVGGGAVEAGPGEIQDADLRVSGDYQGMLAMVQTVYAAGRDAMDRARREMVHRHGPGVMRMEGSAPAAMHPVLAGLHDHMAARTIENPHLGHRAARLGLARHVAEFKERGHTVIERAISEAFADELRERVQSESRAPDAGGLLARHRLFEEIALHPLARTAAHGLLGPDMILRGLSASDAPSQVPDALVVVASWVLDDRGLSLPKGSVVLRDDRSTRPPEAQDVPITITAVYAHPSTGPADGFGSVGEECLRRNPPAFRTLLGLDRAAAETP